MSSFRNVPAVGNITPQRGFSGMLNPWKVDVDRMLRWFTGTGRYAFEVLSCNNAAFNTFGSYNGTANFCDRVGAPRWMLYREITPNVWESYHCPSTESTIGVINANTGPCLGRYMIAKPMLRVRYDAAGVSDQDGGAVAGIIDATSGTNTWYQFTTASYSTAVTRLGFIFGYLQNNFPAVVVTITNNSSGASVIANMLPTAQQLVDDGTYASTVLVANGGTLNPTDRIIDARLNGINTGYQARGPHIPLADNLAPGSYTVRVTATLMYAIGVSSGQPRIYPAYFTYGTGSTTEATPGTRLEDMGHISGISDGSANEIFTLSARPSGSGSYTQIGGGHGYDNATTVDVLCNGVSTAVYSRPLTVARASNVATITSDRSHGLIVGDVITVSGVTATGFNVEGATVTAVQSATSFSYVNSGADLGSTSDNTGRIYNHKLTVCSSLEMRHSGSVYHPSSTTNPLYTYSFVYKMQRWGIEVDSVVTVSQSIDYAASSFNGLMSTWGGFGRGPRWPAMTSYRAIGSALSGSFNRSNGSNLDNQLAGQHSGFVVWGDGVELATIVWSSTPKRSMFDFARGANVSMQDRAGNAVNKIYYQLCLPGPVTAVPVGTVFTQSINRADGFVRNAASKVGRQRVY